MCLAKYSFVTQFFFIHFIFGFKLRIEHAQIYISGFLMMQQNETKENYSVTNGIILRT